MERQDRKHRMSQYTPRARPSNYTDKAAIQPHPAGNLSSLLVTGATMPSGLALFALPAEAHTGTGLAGGFASGFLHPLTGWDHLLAMVSVGLWGAILGRPLIVALPVIFPSMMVVGAFMGILNLPMPPVEIGIALSVLLLGGVIAFGYRAPVWLACVIVAIFAIFHGYAHGKELPSAADPVGYSTGFVLSTGLLHVCGIIIGLINGNRKGQLVVKGLGAMIALAGCVFMTQAII
jgi:urease accessory protein